MFQGGDEENVLTLLTSLTNVCRNDAGLLVKPLDDDTLRKDSAASDTPGRDKASGEVCLLLSHVINPYYQLQLLVIFILLFQSCSSLNCYMLPV